jgi:uncharacterized protein YuzE
MAEKLAVRYDRTGDILYIDTCAPYPEQESEELGDDIIARLNPLLGRVENLEILFFSKRTEALDLLSLPIRDSLRLAS